MSEGKPGTPGADGATGAVGAAGAVGQTGQIGVPGPTGEAGKAGPSPTSRLLIMFVIMMAVFVFISIRVSHNTKEIADNQWQSKVDGCNGAVLILEKFNRFLTDMANVERTGIRSGDDPSLTPVRRERIRIYTQGLQPIPNCKAILKGK